MTVDEHYQRDLAQLDLLRQAGLGGREIAVCVQGDHTHMHYSFGGFRVRQSNNVQHADNGAVILEVT